LELSLYMQFYDIWWFFLLNHPNKEFDASVEVLTIEGVGIGLSSLVAVLITLVRGVSLLFQCFLEVDSLLLFRLAPSDIILSCTACTSRIVICGSNYRLARWNRRLSPLSDALLSPSKLFARVLLSIGTPLLSP